MTLKTCIPLRFIVIPQKFNYFLNHCVAVESNNGMCKKKKKKAKIIANNYDLKKTSTYCTSPSTMEICYMNFTFQENQMVILLCGVVNKHCTLGLGDNTVISYPTVSVSLPSLKKNLIMRACPAPMSVWLSFQFNTLTI